MAPIPGQRRILRDTGLLVEVVATGFSQWISARSKDVEMVQYGTWQDKKWVLHKAPLDDFIAQTIPLATDEWKDFQEYLEARRWAYDASGGRYGASRQLMAGRSK